VAHQDSSHADDWPGIDLEHLPGPTPWPMVLALGMSCLLAGLIISPFKFLGLGVAVLGALLFLAALVALVRQDIALYEGQS
jgi:hypothetical protein